VSIYTQIVASLLPALLLVGPLWSQQVVPQTIRHRPANEYIFDRPSLVVLARVIELSTVERLSDTPGAHVLADKMPQYWTYAQAMLGDVLRVNERREGEPDLRKGYFLVEQEARGDRFIPLELGRVYIFLLDLSPQFQADWKPTDNQLVNLPGYRFAVEQGGFEVVNPQYSFRGEREPTYDGRLRVLQKGGPLDKYDGQLLTEVIREFQQRR
jgi:hypothetical protein